MGSIEKNMSQLPSWFKSNNSYHLAVLDTAYNSKAANLPDSLARLSQTKQARLNSVIVEAMALNNRVYGQLEPTYLTDRYNYINSANLRRWKQSESKIKARAKQLVTLKRLQVAELLDRFEYLFLYWGVRYPTGVNKNYHLYSDDISNEARLAYFEAFTPHCKLGMDKCKSVVNKTEVLPLLTKTGKVARRRQVVYDENGQVIRFKSGDNIGKAVTILQPIHKIKRSYSPSCEKAAYSTLSTAHFRAKNVAKTLTRSGVVETIHSEAKTGGKNLIKYLERNGLNSNSFANSLGIFSPWMDKTLETLKAETSHEAMKSYLSEQGLSQFEDCRLDTALTLASEKGLLSALLENSAGFSYAEIASNTGTSESALLMKISRFRKQIASMPV